MRTIIGDLKENEANLFDKGDKYISALNCINNCVGCFSCWIKHPTKCALKDDYSNIVDLIKVSDELLLVSECKYGCYSSTVKRVLERCIGYVLPYFTIRNGFIHHKSRYNNKIKFIVYFYGKISEDEKECAKKLVHANSINLNASSYEIKFFDKKEEVIKYIH